MANVMILGDGNFSFSLCLVKIIKQQQYMIKSLITSSFDSKDDILKKYPESIPILTSLAQNTEVEVVHDLDATRLHEHSRLMDQNTKFSDIIFNFPHLGVEDLHLHRSFLAHMMKSCLDYLASYSSVLCITLAEAQGIRWKIDAMAERNGLICIGKYPFNHNLWPGYEIKRHQNGKSFFTRVDGCVHYCYQRKNEQDRSINETESVLLNILTQKINVDPIIPPLCEIITPILDKPIVIDVKDSSCIENIQINYDNKRRRYKSPGPLSQITKDIHYRYLTNNWICCVCEKSLATEQGVKSHVLNTHIEPDVLLHIIPSDNSSIEKILDECSSSNLVCKLCNRLFRTEASILQHKLSKHGLYDDITKPDIKYNESYLEESSKIDDEINTQNLIECDVCGLEFQEQDQYLDHIQNYFRPITVEEQESIKRNNQCLTCFKTFKDKRAVNQHMNFCVQIMNTASIASETLEKTEIDINV
eukprot:gene11818-15816_t